MAMFQEHRDRHGDTVSKSDRPHRLTEALYVIRQGIYNMVWKYAPRLAIRLSDATGRGHDDGWDVEEKFRYHKDVFYDYLSFLEVQDLQEFFARKRVLEIGPGDSLNIALRCLSWGAKYYCAVDRFPLLGRPEQEHRLIDLLRADLAATQLARLDALLEDGSETRTILKSDLLRYVQEAFESAPSLHGPFDLIWSRAVLEHVKDLPHTIKRIADLLAPGGVSVHKIDLDCHGMSPNGSPLWFLTVSPSIWRFMGSHRDLPNRYRRSTILDLIKRNGLELLRSETTKQVALEHVNRVRPRLSENYAVLEDSDLSCAGVFLSFRKVSAK